MKWEERVQIQKRVTDFMQNFNVYTCSIYMKQMVFWCWIKLICSHSTSVWILDSLCVSFADMYTCVFDEGIELKEESSTRTSLTMNFLHCFCGIVYPFIRDHQQGWWRKMMNQHFSSFLDSFYLHSLEWKYLKWKKETKRYSNKEIEKKATVYYRCISCDNLNLMMQLVMLLLPLLNTKSKK